MSEKKHNLLGIVAVAIGFVFGLYSGANMLIPMGCALLIGAIGAKVFPDKIQPYLSAIALQIGYMVWFIFGGILVNNFAVVAPDLVIIGIGLCWLYFAPSLIPIVLLSIYHCFTLIFNINNLLLSDFGTEPHKALTVHVIIRIASIILMVGGYKQYAQKQQKEKRNENG